MHRFESLAIISILSISILMTGCNKSNVLSPEIGKTKPVLLQIIKDSSSYAVYSYETGMISEYKYYSAGRLYKTVRLKYNAEGLTETQITEQPYQNYKLVYQYDSNKKINSAEIQLKSDSVFFNTGHLIFTYDANNRITMFEQYSRGIDTPWVRTEFTFDSIGNLTSETVFQRGKLTESTKYEYDSKRNPLNQFRKNDLFAIMFGPNNIIKRTMTEYHPDGQSIVETRYAYIYNSEEYPVSRNVEEVIGGSATTSVETYKYK